MVKLHGGFYYVMDQATGAIRECVRRGRLSKQRIYVGDRVVTAEAGGGKHIIEELLPRKTELARPPVANVDQSVSVFSTRDPKPNFKLLDLFLLLTAAAAIKPVICFNKIDLEPVETYQRQVSAYANAGYQIIATSAKTGEGISVLQEVLRGRVTVIAGPSGAGKSSLLNAVQPGLSLKTAEVSPKTKRGRHITRLVELIPLECGGFVVDTPGFTSVDIPDIPLAILAEYYPEISAHKGKCRFSDCLHLNEPDCVVRKAVEEGAIPSFRYLHYTNFATEITKKERARYF